ncbi:MAG TPA: LysM domain-containing protein [Dehalococcoidia bacterium]|nr:LysM domain-containing protein [Dehalococcoidia bacterium]
MADLAGKWWPPWRGPATEVLAHVYVQPGDTLWDIERRLGVDWQRLYEANGEAIGPDPGLIRPGQVLVVP